MGARKHRSLEVVRSVAMLWIVWMHVHDASVMQAVDPVPVVSAALSASICWTVPAFFVISAYLLAERWRAVGDAWDRAAFARRKLTTIVVPFFAWNLLYQALLSSGLGWPMSWTDILWFVTTGHMHLYFLFLLLQFFALAALGWPHLRTAPGSTAALAVSLVLSAGFYAVSDVWLWSTGVADQHHFEWVVGKLFVGWSAFFAWGLWLGAVPSRLDRVERWRTAWTLAAVVSFAAYTAETWLELQVIGENSRRYFLVTGLAFQFSAATVALLWARAWMRRPAGGALGQLRSAFVAWGSDTYGVYLAHNAILMLCFAAWRAAEWSTDPWVQLLAIGMVTTIASAVFVRLVDRVPVLRRVLLGRDDGAAATARIARAA